MQDQGMFLTVIQLWAAAAWADGKLAKNERVLLEHLINSSELTDATRTQALQYVEHGANLDTVDIEGLAPEQRKGVYRAACRMTTVDRHIDEAERTFLKRLSEMLELDPAAALEIEQAFGSLPR